MPPVNAQRIEVMLAKSGKITESMSEQQKKQQVQSFIRAKQQGFAKKCR